MRICHGVKNGRCRSELPKNTGLEPPQPPILRNRCEAPVDSARTDPQTTPPQGSPIPGTGKPLKPNRGEVSPTAPPQPPAWFFELQDGVAIGYRDNLLHSAFSDLDSALIHGELEARLASTQWRNHRLLMLERAIRTHFLDEPDVWDEDLAFLFAHADYRVSGDWWLGWSASFFSAHQAFDDPDFVDLDGNSAPLHFRQWTLAPQLTWEPNPRNRWGLQAGYRQEETRGLDIEAQDNAQRFLSLDYRHQPSLAHRFRLSYEYARADYDERPARTPTGTPLDERLELEHHEWRTEYRRTWEGDGFRVRGEAGLRLVLEDDHAGGYDDLARLEATSRLEFRQRNGIEGRAEVRYGEYFYDARQVRADDSRHRERSYWAGSLTLEHHFSPRTAWWLGYEFRANQGNKAIDRYAVHSLYTGIRLTF